METPFDVVVLGAGPVGVATAARIAGGGKRVAIVERELIGGECSYWACLPSKALLRPAELLAEAGRVPGAAGAVTGPLDVQAVLDRRDEVIHDLDDAGLLPVLESLSVTLFRGHGALAGERRVKLTTGETIEATTAVVIATGSRAAIPPLPGLIESDPWTNREITTAKEVPDGIVIIGGGNTGSEMAQAWSSLGSRVTIIEGGEHILPREEEFAGELVADALRRAGVDVRLKTRPIAVQGRAGEAGGVTIVLNDGSEIVGDRVVVAVGRTPNTDEIGLESVGLAVGGLIDVDEHCHVRGAEDWLYAIGDVNGHALLTHMGKYQGRVAADRILGKDARLGPITDALPPPRVVFTDPQVAAVGYTLREAKAAGLAARAIDVNTGGNAGGLFYGIGAAGTTRFVVDEERRVLVGATFTGAEVTDFLHAATVAVVGEVTLERLWHAVPSFPTRSELWLDLLAGYGL